MVRLSLSPVQLTIFCLAVGSKKLASDEACLGEIVKLIFDMSIIKRKQKGFEPLTAPVSDVKE